MEFINLRASSRTTCGKQVKKLRAEKWIPAVVYGPDMPARSIQVQERLMFRTLRQASSTMLINLFVDDEPKSHVVLAREIQRDPLTGRLQHADFYEVRLTEKVRTTPRLVIVGEPPLVKSGVAVMIHGMNEVEVECLPTNLVNAIEVDASVLEEMDDNIVVSDLPVPPGVTIVANPDDVVLSLVPTRAAIKEQAEEAAEGAEAEEMASAES